MHCAPHAFCLPNAAPLCSRFWIKPVGTLTSGWRHALRRIYGPWPPVWLLVLQDGFVRCKQHDMALRNSSLACFRACWYGSGISVLRQGLICDSVSFARKMQQSVLPFSQSHSCAASKLVNAKCPNPQLTGKTQSGKASFASIRGSHKHQC